MKRRSKTDEMAQAVGDYPALHALKSMYELQAKSQRMPISPTTTRAGQRGVARGRVLVKVGASLAMVIALGLIVTTDLVALNAPSTLHETMARTGLGGLDR